MAASSKRAMRAKRQQETAAAVEQMRRDRARLDRAWTRLLPKSTSEAARAVVVYHHYRSLVASVLRGIPKRQRATRLKGSLARAMKATVDHLTREARARRV